MSGNREAVRFEKLIERMAGDELTAQEWPVVVGGECSEDDLLDWLKGLDLSALGVRIWWFTDRCTIGDDGPPETAGRLERARLFGEGGDLDLRRDGGRFLWRYVGKAEYGPGRHQGRELEWPATDVSPVYRRVREALLWGTREGDHEQWFEDRVAGAKLTYFVHTPALPDGVEERVKVRFYEYTQAGRTLAVWLLGLKRFEEAKNG